jgi:hypothetical protein
MTPDDIEAIKRRQMIAQMLMQRGQDPIETTQMAGGYVVPVSPLQGLDKVVSSLAGAYMNKQAGEDEKAYKQAKLDAVGAIDFNSDKAASELAKAGYVDEAIKMRMEQAKAMRGESGTPGQWYIPAGATPFKDEATGLVGYKTKEGAIIPSRAAMTDYQQAMTSPAVIASLANAREGQKYEKFVEPNTGQESYRSMTELNPQAYPEHKAAMSPQSSSPSQADNFNFGNLRPPGQSTGFQSFKTPEEGMQAFKSQLDRYLARGLDTPEEIISTYAPPNENPTSALIDNFVKRTGIQRGQVIDKNNPEQLDKLYKAMLFQEQGNKAQAIIDKYLTPMASRSAEATARAKAEAELPVKVAEEQAKSDIAVKETKAKKESEIQTDQEAKNATKVAGAQEALPLLDDAEKYLDNTLSGGAQNFGNKLAEAMGISTEKGQNAAALNAIGSALTSTVPRAPGAQSDIELKYAQQQAGSISDSSIPAETRKKAVAYLKKRNEMIAQGKLIASPDDVKNALQGGNNTSDDKAARLKALREKHGL